ncbi:Na(+)-translocating NADH-quinone reductase subunit B [Anaerohalosphaera lusitana]|uniref:Na(+)-translocating NADH-quinone reductase subunit B n=2 Tax=Anaerohalosphaera lusitana TaxID=1936003 RepID=A0A1U9NNJ3_9BACT|nr:Na(+)-translocating NADH-quinone reductase subunit B [Anaerohalosphaera lusitana]
MRRVLIASIPPAIGAVYFFGWRSLVSLLVCCLTAFIVEHLFCRKRGQPVTEAAFVTAVLFSLVIPPHTPWHVQIIGVSFAIMFSKEVFGGFGKNFFNPALAGRCFVYISFPVALTAKWPPSAPLGGWGALGQWSTGTNTDAITSVTPMAAMKAGGDIPAAFDLFFGGISGSAGVTSAMLILIGGLYLYYTKTASRTTILSVVISYAVLNQILASAGVVNMDYAWTALLGGGFLFGAFYMATDPVSSPRTNWGRIYYGIIIALCTTVIRNFSIFNGGLMFSILLGNMFAPIIDYGVKSYGKRKKAKLAAAGGES